MFEILNNAGKFAILLSMEETTPVDAILGSVNIRVDDKMVGSVTEGDKIRVTECIFGFPADEA
jgi:hypothetical protein